MLKIALTIFLSASFLPIFSSEESPIDETPVIQPIKTTFHISHTNVVLGTASEMEHQEIAASGKFYGALGAGAGMVGGATLGAGVGFGVTVVQGKLVGVTASAAQITTGAFAGAVVGAAVGLAGGVYIGYAYGEAAGEKRANERLKKDIEWMQSSYLDVAFHTTQGDDTLYYLTMRLRPTGGGWKNHLTDQEKSFTSKVEMKWLIGGMRNDQTELFVNQCARYESVFTGDGQASLLKRNISRVSRTFCPEDDHVHMPSSEIRAEELFEGTLPNPVSIFDIANSVVGLQKGLGFLKCSCSGQVITNRKGVDEDVINPAVFTCRLLNTLGVNIAGTSLARVLNANRSGLPVTRDTVIAELYANMENLGLEPNMVVIEGQFPHVIP